MSVIKDKGSCPSAGRCSETLLQVLSCGIPLSIYGKCIIISWEAALLTPASSFCLDLCILATRDCKREGKKTCFPRTICCSIPGRDFLWDPLISAHQHSHKTPAHTLHFSRRDPGISAVSDLSLGVCCLLPQGN